MARGAPGVKRGGRGATKRKLADLAVLYETAQRSQKWRPVAAASEPLLEATGDPLVTTDAALAASLYGVSDASRPKARLRHLRGVLFGNAGNSIVSMIAHFKRRYALSDTMAAAEAITILAQRGVFLGVGAPLDFPRALEIARKAWGARTASAAETEAWTGHWLFVLPVKGGKVPLPGQPGSYLSQSGAWVQDTRFWRQRVLHGDVRLPEKGEKPPTNTSEVTPSCTRGGS